MTGSAPPRRPALHLGARLEDRLEGVLHRRLDDRGWRPVVTAQTGYGLAGSWVRVLARVTLRPPDRAQRPGGGEVRGWRRFVNLSAQGVPVGIEVGGVSVQVTTDREGYVDERIAVDLPAGERTALLRVEAGEGRATTEPVAAPLHVVGPDTEVGLLSDIDDTVMVTMLPRPLVALRNAFWVREQDRRPVPGMSDLYAAVRTAHPGLFTVYLSTGAWNAAPGLRAFLDRHGYPAGPLLLTDWGPTATTWFRSGRQHKRTELARLVTDLPHLRWLLVGDDGQHDPRLYADAVAEHPGRVAGVVIRRLSDVEQVATHGTRRPPGGEVGDAVGSAGGSGDTAGTVHGTPTVHGPDGVALLGAMRRAGLLPG